MFLLSGLSTTVSHCSKMKLSVAAIVLAISGASAYQQPTRSTLRSLGSKSVSVSRPNRKVDATMKMEGEFYNATMLSRKIARMAKTSTK